MAPDDLPFAFTFNDVGFLGNNRSQIPQRFNTSLINLRYITIVQFKWRFKKMDIIAKLLIYLETYNSLVYDQFFLQLELEKEL